jgi:hypothetical protein
MVEAWGRAHQALAIEKRPKLGLSGTLLDELWEQGHDHRFNVKGYVGSYEEFSGKPYDERTEEVPALPPGDYSGFITLNRELIALLESELQRLWTEATGHLQSQPRFNLPTSPLVTEVDAIVAKQKARIRGYLKPSLAPARRPTRPPRYVVVCEGTKYTLKRQGLDEAKRTKVESRTVAKSKLKGIVKTIMEHLEDEYFERYEKAIVSKQLDITKAREAFLKVPPILLTYAGLARLSNSGAGTTKKSEALSELSLLAKLDADSMAAYRQQVKRFNEFWRKETKDEGSWLAPYSDSTSSTRSAGGCWKLQVMLLLPPEKRE